MTDRLRIALCQLNPTVGAIAGKRRAGAARPRRGGGSGRRSDADQRIGAQRLSAGRPGAETLLPGQARARGRRAYRRYRRRRPGAAADHTLAGGKEDACPGAQRRPAAGSGQAGHRPLQGGSAKLRRVRRKAGLRARRDAGAHRLPRRADRRADLRGYLGRGCRRMSGGERRRVPDRPQRVALRGRQARFPDPDRDRQDCRERIADRLSQPGRRPGRTGVRRSVLRAERGPHAGGHGPSLRGSGADHGLGARGGRLALPAGRDRRPAGPPARDVSGHGSGAAGLCSEEWVFRVSSWACPAGSTPLCRRRLRSMPWGRRKSTA